MITEEEWVNQCFEAQRNYVKWFNSLTDADIAVDVDYNESTDLVDIIFRDGHVLSFDPNAIVPKFDYRYVNSFYLSNLGTDIRNEECDFDMHIVDLIKVVGESNV